MGLERIGPSVAFADAQRGPGSQAAHSGSPLGGARPRPRALGLGLSLSLEYERDPAYSAPPTPAPCSSAPAVPLARSSSARSAYSLRSFGRQSDILATPAAAHMPPAPSAPVSRVASIGTPRTGRGNVDVSSPARPPAARTPRSASTSSIAPVAPDAPQSSPLPTHTPVPPPTALGLTKIAPPSPPSLSLPAPPSPPLPPAAPAPSPACAPQRTTGRNVPARVPSVGAQGPASPRVGLRAPLLSPPRAATGMTVPATSAWLQEGTPDPLAFQRRRRSGRFLAATLSQRIQRGKPVPCSEGRAPPCLRPADQTDQPDQADQAGQDPPTPPEGSDPTSRWGHVVPSLGSSLAGHRSSISSADSSSPGTAQSNEFSIDRLLLRLQQAAALDPRNTLGPLPPECADTGSPVSSPPAGVRHIRGRGMVLRTPTTISPPRPAAPGPLDTPKGLMSVKEESKSHTSSPEGHPHPAKDTLPYASLADGGKRQIGDFDLLREIGRGAYGVVSLARLRSGVLEEKSSRLGETVVIKSIVKSRILADCWRRHRTLGTIPTEIHVMEQLRRMAYRPPTSLPPWAPEVLFPHLQHDTPSRDTQDQPGVHPGMAQMLDFFEDAEYYYLVMRRFGRGQDVFDYVEASVSGLSAAQIRGIGGQVAAGVSFLHARGIVHRDIKDENVILAGSGHAQLIDFGSAAHVPRLPRKRFDTFSGTLDFAAPEILRGETYDGPPQDVWALGIVLYVLLCGECPFWNGQEALHALEPSSRAAQTLRDRVALGSGPVPSGQAAVHDDGGGALADLVDAITQCLALDVAARPLARHVATHRFFAGSRGWVGPRGWVAQEAHDPHLAMDVLGPDV